MSSRLLTAAFLLLVSHTLGLPHAPSSAIANDVSFRRDVMPILFRAGCNSGTCHGSARGKDGFHLSLFGYDPRGDYFRISQQMIGRRINVARPERSLLLKKAIGKVPHTGGKLFDADSEYYNTLLNWIEAGAVDDSGPVPEVVGTLQQEFRIRPTRHEGRHSRDCCGQ
jgi:hypothetical protein